LSCLWCCCAVDALAVFDDVELGIPGNTARGRYSCFCAVSGGFDPVFWVGCSSDEQVTTYTTSDVLGLHSGVVQGKRAVHRQSQGAADTRHLDPLLQIGRAASTRGGVHFTEGSVSIDAIDATRPGEGRWTPPRAP